MGGAAAGIGDYMDSLLSSSDDDYNCSHYFTLTCHEQPQKMHCRHNMYLLPAAGFSNLDLREAAARQWCVLAAARHIQGGEFKFSCSS